MSKAIKKTRAQWAADICAVHKRTVEGIFEMGRTLIEAKKKLPHGEFTAMIASDLPFSARTAQMLMAVAADPRLAKANRGALLPATWRVLYELHTLSDEDLEHAMQSGAVNPQMTRNDVRALRPPVMPPSDPSQPVLNIVARAREPEASDPPETVNLSGMRAAPPSGPEHDNCENAGPLQTIPCARSIEHVSDNVAVLNNPHPARPLLYQMMRLGREFQAAIDRDKAVLNDTAFVLSTKSLVDLLLAAIRSRMH